MQLGPRASCVFSRRSESSRAASKLLLNAARRWVPRRKLPQAASSQQILSICHKLRQIRGKSRMPCIILALSCGCLEPTILCVHRTSPGHLQQMPHHFLFVELWQFRICSRTSFTLLRTLHSPQPLSPRGVNLTALRVLSRRWGFPSFLHCVRRNEVDRLVDRKKQLTVSRVYVRLRCGCGAKCHILSIAALDEVSSVLCPC